MTGSPQKLVLIVEDNDLNMKLFRDLLDAHGYRTLHTRDGINVLGIAGAAGKARSYTDGYSTAGSFGH